jgi:hypothetical protein
MLAGGLVFFVWLFLVSPAYRLVLLTAARLLATAAVAKEAERQAILCVMS